MTALSLKIIESLQCIQSSGISQLRHNYMLSTNYFPTHFHIHIGELQKFVEKWNWSTSYFGAKFWNPCIIHFSINFLKPLYIYIYVYTFFFFSWNYSIYVPFFLDKDSLHCDLASASWVAGTTDSSFRQDLTMLSNTELQVLLPQPLESLALQEEATTSSIPLLGIEPGPPLCCQPMEHSMLAACTTRAGPMLLFNLMQCAHFLLF